MTKEELLGKFSEPKKVLDHGFVRLVDVMGDDSAVVQAARVAYGAGTKNIREDRGLLRYLMRMRHTSPFEQCELKVHAKMPIFVARQWVRHRTASLNEMSGRYSEMPNEMYRPENWRAQSRSNKQGSHDEDFPLDVSMTLDGTQEFQQNLAHKEYQGRLKAGVAREMARIDLPLSQYTEWYWKIDLHNLMHFLGLRLDSHAQYEMRLYAEAIAEIVKVWVPQCWEAFVDYRLEARTLSRMEVEVVRTLVGNMRPDWLGETGMSKREVDELKGWLFGQEA